MTTATTSEIEAKNAAKNAAKLEKLAKLAEASKLEASNTEAKAKADASVSSEADALVKKLVKRTILGLKTGAKSKDDAIKFAKRICEKLKLVDLDTVGNSGTLLVAYGDIDDSTIPAEFRWECRSDNSYGLLALCNSTSEEHYWETMQRLNDSITGARSAFVKRDMVTSHPYNGGGNAGNGVVKLGNPFWDTARKIHQSKFEELAEVRLLVFPSHATRIGGNVNVIAVEPAKLLTAEELEAKLAAW